MANKPFYTDEQIRACHKAWASGQFTLSEISLATGISPNTLHRRFERLGLKSPQTLQEPKKFDINEWLDTLKKGV